MHALRTSALFGNSVSGHGQQQHPPSLSISTAPHSNSAPSPVTPRVTSRNDLFNTSWTPDVPPPRPLPMSPASPAASTGFEVKGRPPWQGAPAGAGTGTGAASAAGIGLGQPPRQGQGVAPRTVSRNDLFNTSWAPEVPPPRPLPLSPADTVRPMGFDVTGPSLRLSSEHEAPSELPYTYGSTTRLPPPPVQYQQDSNTPLQTPHAQHASLTPSPQADSSSLTPTPTRQPLPYSPSPPKATLQSTPSRAQRPFLSLATRTGPGSSSPSPTASPSASTGPSLYASIASPVTPELASNEFASESGRPPVLTATPERRTSLFAFGTQRPLSSHGHSRGAVPFPGSSSEFSPVSVPGQGSATAPVTPSIRPSASGNRNGWTEIGTVGSASDNISGTSGASVTQAPSSAGPKTSKTSSFFATASDNTPPPAPKLAPALSVVQAQSGGASFAPSPLSLSRASSLRARALPDLPSPPPPADDYDEVLHDAGGLDVGSVGSTRSFCSTEFTHGKLSNLGAEGLSGRSPTEARGPGMLHPSDVQLRLYQEQAYLLGEGRYAKVFLASYKKAGEGEQDSSDSDGPVRPASVVVPAAPSDIGTGWHLCAAKILSDDRESHTMGLREVFFLNRLAQPAPKRRRTQSPSREGKEEGHKDPNRSPSELSPTADAAETREARRREKGRVYVIKLFGVTDLPEGAGGANSPTSPVRQSPLNPNSSTLAQGAPQGAGHMRSSSDQTRVAMSPQRHQRTRSSTTASSLMNRTGAPRERVVVGEVPIGVGGVTAVRTASNAAVGGDINNSATRNGNGNGTLNDANAAAIGKATARRTSSPLAIPIPIPTLGPVLLLEHAPLGTLDRLLRTSPTLVGPELWGRWARESSEALEWIHCRGVLHCDVKPGNLLLTADLHIRLSDFGSSLMVHPQHPPTDGVGLGTLPFSPPELVDPTKPFSFPVDVFSLGATLYQCITGREPYRGSRPVEIMHHVRGGGLWAWEELQRLSRVGTGSDTPAVMGSPYPSAWRDDVTYLPLSPDGAHGLRRGGSLRAPQPGDMSLSPPPTGTPGTPLSNCRDSLRAERSGRLMRVGSAESLKASDDMMSGPNAGASPAGVKLLASWARASLSGSFSGSGTRRWDPIFRLLRPDDEPDPGLSAPSTPSSPHFNTAAMSRSSSLRQYPSPVAAHGVAVNRSVSMRSPAAGNMQTYPAPPQTGATVGRSQSMHSAGVGGNVSRSGSLRGVQSPGLRSPTSPLATGGSRMDHSDGAYPGGLRAASPIGTTYPLSSAELSPRTSMRQVASMVTGAAGTSRQSSVERSSVDKGVSTPLIHTPLSDSPVRRGHTYSHGQAQPSTLHAHFSPSGGHPMGRSASGTSTASAGGDPMGLMMGTTATSHSHSHSHSHTAGTSASHTPTSGPFFFGTATEETEGYADGAPVMYFLGGGRVPDDVRDVLRAMLDPTPGMRPSAAEVVKAWSELGVGAGVGEGEGLDEREGSDDAEQEPEGRIEAAGEREAHGDSARRNDVFVHEAGTNLRMDIDDRERPWDGERMDDVQEE